MPSQLKKMRDGGEHRDESQIGRARINRHARTIREDPTAPLNQTRLARRLSPFEVDSRLSLGLGTATQPSQVQLRNFNSWPEGTSHHHNTSDALALAPPPPAVPPP